MTGGSNKRVSVAALIAVKPGQRPRLIYRVHHGRGSRKDQRKGFTEAVCVPINASAQVNSHRRVPFTVRHDRVSCWPASPTAPSPTPSPRCGYCR
jgi:hypothetical protein